MSSPVHYPVLNYDLVGMVEVVRAPVAAAGRRRSRLDFGTQRWFIGTNNRDLLNDCVSVPCVHRSIAVAMEDDGGSPVQSSGAI
jgi:hypothetical protein